MKKITIILWFFTIIGLFLYSFTQVDLNLTLVRTPLINTLIKDFQHIGYFQRPVSTGLYLLIMGLLYLLYLSFLSLSKKGLMEKKELWLIIIATSAILLFSYPAFSYDIYNYMFDAKTVVLYHKSPWQFRPLYFAGDSWLYFMHWTHRPSVYPPGWILMSLPFFWAGFNYFVLILLNFKLLMTLGFLGSIWILEKLLSFSVIPAQAGIHKNSIDSRFCGNDAVFLLAFFALNPLMLTENLVSGHNDIVMMFIILLSFWLATQKRKVLSIIYYLLSILIKYITAVFLPIIFLYDWLRKRTDEVTIYRYSLILVFAAAVFTITRIDLQPWYLVWLMPFIVLSRWKFLWPVTIGLSLGLLLRYSPFLYFGDWNFPVPTFEFWLTLVPVVISLLITPFLLKKKNV